MAETKKTPLIPPRDERRLASRGTTLIEPVFLPETQKSRQMTRLASSTLAGTNHNQPVIDTLCPDNGGDSGQSYPGPFCRSCSGWQLPGPFTPAVCEWAFTSRLTSLAHVPALLFRINVVRYSTDEHHTGFVSLCQGAKTADL